MLKSVLKLLFIFLFCLQGFHTTGCTQKGGQHQLMRDQITPMETMGMIRNDFAVLIDVREENEISDGIAQPAKWFPYSKIEKDDQSFKHFIAQQPKDKLLVFYCAAGTRAQKVAQALASQGRSTANLGGFQDWVKAGLPIRKNP